MIEKEGVINKQKGRIEREIEPENWIGTQPDQMVEQSRGDQRPIDNSDQGQRAHTRPFAFGREPECPRGIPQNNRANETSQNGRDTGWPDRQLELRQQEEAQAHKQIEQASQKCEHTLNWTEYEMFHPFLLPTHAANDYI